MKLSVPATLLLIALALAPWLGGSVWLEAQSGDAASLYDIFIARNDAAWAQFILALLVFGSVIWTGLSRSVLQVPSQRVLGSLFLCWVFVALAVLASQHKHVSLLEFARWTCMFFTVVAATSVFGRDRGARLAIGAIVLGASAVALTGISEFIEASRYSPNWRIFAGWQNPNAVAGMFALALPLAAALIAVAEDKSARLLAFVAFVVTGAALWLTASKGGLLSAFIGLLAFAMFALLSKSASKTQVVRVIAAIALCGVFTIGISQIASISGGKGAVAGSRLAASSEESSQSFAFRKQLWSDALELATKNPVTGVGPGAFSIEIKKVSSTQGSAVSHNGFLQLAAESGIFAGVSLILALLLWLLIVAKKHVGMPAASNTLRCAVIGAVTAGVVDSLVESSFSYFGWSLCFFGLLGIGLLFAVDGVAPERAPIGSRVLGMAVVSISALSYLMISAIADTRTRAGLAAMSKGEGSAAEDSLLSASGIAPADPAPRMQLARLYIALGEIDKARGSARTAVSLSPTAARYAVLAESEAKSGKNDDAAESYATGASLEPHSPVPLRKQFEFLLSIEDPRAAEIAKKLIAMEKSEYFSLSAIPWLIPTDTIGAREFLASRSKGSDAIELLEGAADVLRRYIAKTVPELRRLTGMQVYDDAKSDLRIEKGREPTEEEIATKLGMTQNELYDWVTERSEFRIAGESLSEAAEKTQKLRDILMRLAALYRSARRPADASKAEVEAGGLK